MLPEGLLFKLLDVMKVGLTYVDENEKLVYSNNEAAELLSMDRQMLGSTVLSCHPEEFRRAVTDKISEMKESASGEWHGIIRRNGHYLENYYTPVFIGDRYRGIVIATRDVTERETLLYALKKSNDEMAVLFEAAQMVNESLNIKQVLENIVRLAQKVVGFDAGGILLFDRATKEIIYDATYNYSPDEVASLKHCRPFRQLVGEVDKEYFIEPVEDHFTCSLVSKIEMAVPMVINNNIYGIWFVENHRDSQFTADRKHMLATLANLTSSAIKNAWLYERTKFEATIDQLTGLYNRQYFDHVLEMEKEKTRLIQVPLSLIMADVNRLKYINDNFGHEFGDYIIKEAATILKKSVRKGELVFRFGGDEMVILLPASDYETTGKVVRRIKANAEKWNRQNKDGRLFLHMSIGWYTATDAESLEKLVCMADREMYRDKEEYYVSHGLRRETLGPR